MLKPLDSLLVLFVLGLKVWLMVSWPLTGPEAQWIWWSQAPSLGHYDHGPMVGWVLALLHLHSDALWWLRSLGILASFLFAWVIYLVLSVAEPSLVFRRRHILVALAFFVSPVSVVFFVTTESTVLGLLAFLGFATQAAAVIRRSIFWALASGLLLGAALSANFLVAVPTLSLFLFALFQVRRIGWAVPVASVIGVLPSLGIAVVYNYGHCWNNVLSGLFVPLRSGQWGADHALQFLGMLLFFAGPWSLWHWIRCGGRHTGILRTELGLLVKFASLPLLLVLFALSLRHDLGLLWPVLLVPMVWLLLRALPEAALTSIFRWSALSALVLGLCAAILLNDPARWLNAPERRALLLHSHAQELCALLPSEPLFVLDSGSHAVLSVSCRHRDIRVFADSSGQGRETDLAVDFRALDGKEIQIFLDETDLSRIEPFFESVSTSALNLAGTRYAMATASGFRYAAYREAILEPMIKRFYEVPYWFPQPGACPIRERYGL